MLARYVLSLGHPWGRLFVTRLLSVSVMLSVSHSLILSSHVLLYFAFCSSRASTLRLRSLLSKPLYWGHPSEYNSIENVLFSPLWSPQAPLLGREVIWVVVVAGRECHHLSNQRGRSHKWRTRFDGGDTRTEGTPHPACACTGRSHGWQDGRWLCLGR